VWRWRGGAAERGDGRRARGRRRGCREARALSIGLPEPLKMRPSMSSDTGVVRMLPENSTDVPLLSMPDVPSKT